MSEFDASIRAWIDAIEGDLVVPVEAGKFVAQADADELRAWLWERADLFVSRVMGDFVRSERASAVAQRQSKRFAEAAAAGDVSAFRSYLDERYVVDDELTRRPLRAMSKDDVLFVATAYAESSKAHAFKAAILRTIAKRTPKGKTVGDVFTDEQLRRLYGDETDSA